MGTAVPSSVITTRPLDGESPITPTIGLLSSVRFEWRATCGGLLASCDLLYTDDEYPAGETNDLPGNADYAFKTLAPPASDLFANASVDAVVCPGLDLAGRASGSAHNGGASAVGRFVTQWLWSTDNVLSSDDRVLPGGRYAVDGLPAGGHADVPPPTLPADLPYGAGHLLLQVDVDNSVREPDDANNVAAPPTTVTSCEQPNLTSLDLSVAEEEVGAGFNEVQFADLPARALATLPQSEADISGSPAFQPNAYSPNGYSPNGYSPNAYSNNGFAPNAYSPNAYSPNAYSPNGYSPNGYSPNGYSPAGGILLREVLDDLPASLVAAAHVVDIPIVGDGWETRLSGLTDEPIQGVTLDEASALLPALRLDEVDPTRVFDSSTLAVALANAPLQSIPIDWCGLVAEHGSSCAGLGVDPQQTSLLGLEGSGFPAFQAPIADMSLAEVTPDARWLVMGLPLSGERSFHLGLTRIGQMPADEALSSAPVVVDCTNFDCSRPLVEAQDAGAVNNVDVGDLVAALSPAGRAAMTLGDLGMGIASVGSLRLSAANWNVADVPAMDPSCPRVNYELRGTNSEGSAVDPEATVVLPAGFAYVPGTVSVAVDGGSPAPLAEPTSTLGADGARTYTFSLDAAIDSSFELGFAACANVYLGSTTVGSATVSGQGIAGPYARSTTSSDRVLVIERSPGVTSRTVLHEDNVVIADHVSVAGDHDSWSFPVKPEPGTLYVVKLFPPAGVDYDLIAYGPENSSLAFTPNGYSPNGYSPNAYSPNAFSPNAFSPNGYSPNGYSPNGYSPNGYSPNGYSTTSQPDLNDDLPIEELRPADSFGVAVSANRGDTVETLHLLSHAGDAGEFTFAVADYNGSRSNAPYFLTIQTIRPTHDPALNECASPPWDVSEPPGPAPMAWSKTTPPKTLFVVNDQVTRSAYGSSASDSGVSALRELAARPEVNGIVLNVDSDPDVRAAYAGWRAEWCDPTAANVVATQIRRLILEMREQYPSIDTIVLAGGDTIVPDFRLDDRSSMANEDTYTDALLRATRINNPLVAAYANGMIPSADPYGNEGALPFGMSYAFPPSAGVSRLVETPLDWAIQRDQYVLSNGALEPTSAFISAYDGMVDGAEAAAAALHSGSGVPSSLLTDSDRSWTAADFRAGAFASGSRFGGWNGHANHFGLLSDDGSERNDVAEQITTAEGDDIPLGTFVFSNGCHFGTAIDDLLNGAPTESERARLADWAQTLTSRRGIAVANTGYGIFDTVEVGQGERLQQYLMEELHRSSNVSLALVKAKNRFFAAPGVYDAYTYKTLHQLQVYGLGIFKMFGSSAEPATPPAPPATTSIGIDAGPYTVDRVGTSACTDCYRVHPSPAGDAVELIDPGLEVGHTSTQGLWSGPTSIQKVALPEGTLPAGVWYNQLESATLTDVDLVNTRLAVDDPARELEPQTSGPFPTSLGTVNTVGRTAHVNLLHGIAVPQRKVDGRVRGDIHLYTRIDAELLLRANTTEGCRPTIRSVTTTRLPNSDRVAVEVVATSRCGATTRGAVLGRLTNGTWVYAEAVKADGERWLTSLTVPAGQSVEDLLAQVSSDRGVGYWRFKGDRPVINQGTVDGVDVTLAGNRHPSGIYRSDVTATVSGSSGVVYEAFDNDVLVGRFTTGSSFTISGDGPHEISVYGSDGSAVGTFVVLDTTAPVITWVSPAANGLSVRAGTPVTLDVRCADASGASCEAKVGTTVVPNGSLLPTSKIGTYDVVVTSTDAVGNASTSARRYTVTSRYTISQFFSPTLAKPSMNVVSPTSTVALKFTVSDAGVEQTDPAIIATRYWQPIACKSPFGPAGASVTATGTQPAYSGFFHFNVSAPAQAGCYELFVQLVDGTTQSAYFQVKR